MEYHYIEKRYNVMGLSSIGAFAGIKGGMNGNCKDVYFLRVTGVSPEFRKEVEDMDSSQTGKMLLGQGIYNRVGAFPKNISAGAVDVYTQCYHKWVESGKEKLYTGKLGEGSELGELLGAACKKTLEMYRAGNPHFNESIEKNFVVKLLFWLDELACDFLENWNPKQSMKFVAQGIGKEQEYFFCYFLTLIGIDVLLLQNEADIEEKLEHLNLSKKLELGENGAVVLEAYDRQKWAERKAEPGRVSQGSGQQMQPQPDNPSSQRPKVVIPPRAGRSGAGFGGQGDVAGRADTGNGSAAGGIGSGGNTDARDGIRSESSFGNGTGPGGRTEGGTWSSGSTTGRAGGGTGSAGNFGQNAGSMAGGSGRIAPHGTDRPELDFEELALLASSVVMIAIHDRKGDIIGSGSGIMIGQQGYILTNNHVARGGMYYSVRIENDNNMYKTDEIIKYNSVLDLAVIRIDRRLQPLPIYRGRKPLVRGQKVVAIGSPLGLFNSVSNGIISGFRRMDNVDMIQFTAPISHGSSGGAVLNMYGEVIGVSTAGIDEGQNINLAVGYEFINTFIKGFQ